MRAGVLALCTKILSLRKEEERKKHARVQRVGEVQSPWFVSVAGAGPCVDPVAVTAQPALRTVITNIIGLLVIITLNTCE